MASTPPKRAAKSEITTGPPIAKAATFRKIRFAATMLKSRTGTNTTDEANIPTRKIENMSSSEGSLLNSAPAIDMTSMPKTWAKIILTAMLPPKEN